MYAIIPARGGSKGVPDKNIRLLGGHPVIAWSIVAAKLCKKIDRVIVSTDDPKVGQIAKLYGAEVPFSRPAEFATDSSPDREFVVHALDWFAANDKEPDYLVHLRPTTPLRDPKILDEAIDKIQSTPEATALRSVHELAEPPHKMLQIKDGYLAGFFPDDTRLEYYNLPRQQLPTGYLPNGYIDILKTSFIRQSKSLHGSQMLSLVTEQAIEIDMPTDIDHIEYELSHNGSKLLEHLDRIKNNTQL